MTGKMGRAICTLFGDSDLACGVIIIAVPSMARPSFSGLPLKKSEARTLFILF